MWPGPGAGGSGTQSGGRGAAAVVVDGHEGEGGVGDLPRPSVRKARPGLDMDSSGPADPLDFRVDAEHVADLDRLDEGHRIDCDDDAPRARWTPAMPPATSIWLITQPPKMSPLCWYRPARDGAHGLHARLLWLGQGR
jgi:hypothetical protein